MLCAVYFTDLKFMRIKKGLKTDLYLLSSYFYNCLLTYYSFPCLFSPFLHCLSKKDEG